MGLRFRKQITIFPGVKLNISKTGLSLSVGKKGAHFNAGTSGRKSVSVGIPGTGLSYTKNISSGKKTLGVAFTAVVIAGAVIMGLFKYKDKIAGFFGAGAGQKSAVETTVEGGADPSAVETYVINTSTKKYHLSTCRYAKGDNVKSVQESKTQLEKEGYTACKTCKP